MDNQMDKEKPKDKSIKTAGPFESELRRTRIVKTGLNLDQEWYAGVWPQAVDYIDSNGGDSYFKYQQGLSTMLL